MIIFIPFGRKRLLEYLMRFFFCKTRCPSICFCQPSSHSNTPSSPSPSPSPLQSQGKPPDIPCNPSAHVSADEPETPSHPASAEEDRVTKGLEPRQTSELDQNNAHVNGSVAKSNAKDNHHHHPSNGSVNSNCTGHGSILKGNLRKTSSDSVLLVQKKKVQWVDHVGKQLVEIREFDYSEDVDNGGMSNGGCKCTISQTWNLRLSVSIPVAIVQFSSSCLRSMHRKRKG